MTSITDRCLGFQRHLRHDNFDLGQLSQPSPNSRDRLLNVTNILREISFFDMTTAIATIFQSSDLNQRGRSILDAAREGFARIRDKDGASLVMTREERFGELERRGNTGERLADLTANFMLVENAVEHRSGIEPGLADLGDWVWLRYLPMEDLSEFVAEIREVLYTACREHSVEQIEESLDAWRETALALRDPLSRETLLSKNKASDYVEAKRPDESGPQTPAQA